jgi:putative N6-adenine-specific DNA methylase
MNSFYQCYIIVPIGSEERALEEMNSWITYWSGSSRLLSKNSGGLLVEGPLDEIIKFNHALKIPVRILLRLTEFKARDFPKLFQKASQIDWNDYLLNPHPQFKISSHTSRLMHTDRMSETFLDAIKKYLKHHPIKQKWINQNLPPATFFVRSENDGFTLSLDLSGEPLYKRNLQPLKGIAPIRENLAAWLLLEILKDIKGEVDLIDPMCGSGTFLFEALSLGEMINRPMAYQTSPFQRAIKFQSRPLPYSFAHLYGYDIDQLLINKINPKNSLMTFSHHDLFTNQQMPKPNNNRTRILICNPPYGFRIKTHDHHDYFLTLLKKIDQYQSDKALVIIPHEKLNAKIKAWATEVMTFSNGGITVCALIKSNNRLR